MRSQRDVNQYFLSYYHLPYASILPIFYELLARGLCITRKSDCFIIVTVTLSLFILRKGK